MPAACSARTIILNSRTDAEGRAGGRVADAGGEEREGVVAPVVREALLDQVAVVGVVVDRQQLDGGHAELLQVLDGRLGGEPGVGAAQRLRDLGVEPREALDVELVDDGLVPRRARRGVVAPGEGGVDDGGERGEVRVVAVVEGEVLGRVADPVAEHLVAPLDRAGDGLGVGIEDDLVGVEAVPGGGLVGPVHAVAVELAGLHVGQVGVPDEVGLLGHADACRLARVLPRVEQAELHRGRVLGEEGEVDAQAVPGRPEGIGPAGPDADGVHRTSSSSATGRWRKTVRRGAGGARGRPSADTSVPVSASRQASRAARGELQDRVAPRALAGGRVGEAREEAARRPRSPRAPRASARRPPPPARGARRRRAARTRPSRRRSARDRRRRRARLVTQSLRRPSVAARSRAARPGASASASRCISARRRRRRSKSTGAAVVRVDEAELRQLRPLVEVRDAGRGHLEHDLGHRVQQPRPQHDVEEAEEVGGEGVPRPGLEGGGDEVPQRLLVGLVRAHPARVDLGLARRLLHVLLQPPHEVSPRVVGAEPGGPRPHQRLVEEVLRVRVGRLRLVHRRLARRGSSPASARPPRSSAPARSERTLIRARTSSSRFVSWVEVAIIARGQSSRRSAFAAWKRSRAFARSLRLAAHLVERGERVEAVGGGVLEALRHHRAGELLEPHHEVEPLGAGGLVESLGVLQEQHGADEVEERRVHRRVAPAGEAHGEADVAPVLGVDLSRRPGCSCGRRGSSRSPPPGPPAGWSG